MTERAAPNDLDPDPKLARGDDDETIDMPGRMTMMARLPARAAPERHSSPRMTMMRRDMA